MSKAGEERYVFETDWFDQQASLIRKYLFTFFPTDSTIEMVSDPVHNIHIRILTVNELNHNHSLRVNDRYDNVESLSNSSFLW